jgi:hypothetical protein
MAPDLTELSCLYVHQNLTQRARTGLGLLKTSQYGEHFGQEYQVLYGEPPAVEIEHGNIQLHKGAKTFFSARDAQQRRVAKFLAKSSRFGTD